MSRSIVVSAARMGPIERAAPRARIVERLRAPLAKSASLGARPAVLSALALTTFFRRRSIDGASGLDGWLDGALPAGAVRTLLDDARRPRACRCDDAGRHATHENATRRRACCAPRRRAPTTGAPPPARFHPPRAATAGRRAPDSGPPSKERT